MPKSAIPDMLSHLPRTPGVTEELIAETQQLISYELPADLLDFYRECNGADNTAYTTIPAGTPHIRLTPMEDWVANSDDYDFAPRKLVMIGADGGPFAYCLSLKTLPMQYRVIDFGDSGQGDYLGSSFAEFLESVRDERKLKAPKTKEKPKPLPPLPKDKPLRELKGFPYGVDTMALSPDGGQVLGVTRGGHTSILFALHTGKSEVLTPNGKELYLVPAAGWMNGRAMLCGVGGVICDPGGKSDTRSYLFDGMSGEVLCEWFYNQKDSGSGDRGSFSPDGTRLVITGARAQFFIDPSSGKTIAPLPRPSNYALSLAWTSDSQFLALGRFDHADTLEGSSPDWGVLVVDRDGKELARIKVDPDDRHARDRPGVRCVQFNGGGDRLLVVTDKAVEIYAMQGAIPSAQPVTTFRVPMRHLHAACFVGNDRLAVTTAEGQIVLFSLDAPKPIRTWQSSKLQARLLLATPDGKLLLTANGDELYSGPQAVSKTIRVWQVDV